MQQVSILLGGRFHAFDLARELQQRGVLRRLITNYPKFKTQQWQLADDRVVSLPASLIIERALLKTGSQAWCYASPHVLRLFSEQASRHLDGSTVVHGWSGYSHSAMDWARANAVPFVLERSSAHITTQTEILDEEYARLGLRWPRTHPSVIEEELDEYSRADLIAVPSLFVKQTFLAKGFAESRLLHSPFGANLESFKPGPKADSIFRVVYAGQLSARKGIHYLLQAFRSLARSDNELCLVGSTAPESPVLLTAANDRVRYAGNLPQHKLAALYRTGSVFVMASVEEGLATVQAQAMACGLPLICTTNTGGEDLLRMSGALIARHDGNIDEYPAGYVVPVRDPEALTRCMRWLAEDRDLLADKRSAALMMRTTGLDWGTYADRIVQGYEWLTA